MHLSPPTPAINLLFVRIYVYWLHIDETQPETRNHLLVSGSFPGIQEEIVFVVFS